KDEKGKPIIGANIIVKGTSTGSITNVEGDFSLANVPDGATLEISFIGYLHQDVKVNGSGPVSIILKEDARMLGEVIVVGYGVQKKSDVTGAVTALNTKMLDERPQTNIIQSLQGAVAGLNISITGTNAEGSSSSTVIRGTNSIAASNKPLIILDGIPFDGPWSEINSNDVQSIEVLKDASSAAIYGARGSNGVILITTKKGEKGKMSISYNANFIFSSPVNIPRMMNGEEFWKYKTEAIQASGKDDYLAEMTATEIRMHEAGQSTDWLDLATRNAFSQQHNLSFRGGAGQTQYFISANYINNEGITVNNQFERYNFRINLDQEFSSWLKFSTSTQLGRYDRSGNSPDFGRAFLMPPLAEAYNEDGSIKLKAWENSSDQFNRNPLSNINEKTADIRYKVITGNALDFTIPFIEGLSYKLNTGFTYESSTYKNYEGRDTYYGEQKNGQLNTDDWNKTDWIIENILSYVRAFGRHNIFFTGMYSSESAVYEQNKMTGADFPNDVMTYYQASKAGTLSGSSSYWKQSHISQMARLNYSYDSRYLLTLTARRDGYSAFGENSKFGIFPSVALGWNVYNERFYRQLNIKDYLSNLKLRISYGKNGNEAISGAYATLPNLSTFNYLTEDRKPMYGFYPQKLASPSLGWETTTSLNAGVDFGWLNGRIQGSFDAYWSNTEDLLLNRTIPTINGTDNLLENIGKTANNGFEWQITSTNVDNRDFNWSTTFNLSHYNTKIKDVGLYDENGKPVDDVASGWFIGQPVNVNYGYVFDGIWQITDSSNPNGQQDPEIMYSIPGYVKYKDIDGEKGITTDDREIIGRRIPDFTVGMLNTFNYKDFSLSFFLNSQVGVTARNYLWDVNGASYTQNKMMIDFWTPDNPINTYPKNMYSSVDPYGAGFYEKTDFLRLQDVTLSYRLPQALFKKVDVNRLEIFMNIKNLATWTNWTGLDPEYIGSQRATPALRSFILGFKLDF
ncbi:MAG: TonB-dependent receptor, partial [Tannerellaceae bacterium]|nr:TonB-dependent receptor [Tannerellaceae bacterium]